MRIFSIGKWFYIVQAVYLDEVAREKAARHFVESCKHIGWK